MNSSQNSNMLNKGEQDIIWLEVKCKDSDTLKGENEIEVKNVSYELVENSGWLPDKIEKKGNWFVFDTHFSQFPPNQNDNVANTLHILCGNLSQDNTGSSTILFHLDYWKKQLMTKAK